MVYTVTFNPSLDYIVEVKSFELGMTNRTSYEHMLPGGKGINVSIVLNNLEFDIIIIQSHSFKINHIHSQTFRLFLCIFHKLSSKYFL